MTTGTRPCACGCGQPRDRPGQSYRRECHARYMRKWRARRKGIDGLIAAAAALELEQQLAFRAELDMLILIRQAG